MVFSEIFVIHSWTVIQLGEYFSNEAFQILITRYMKYVYSFSIPIIHLVFGFPTIKMLGLRLDSEVYEPRAQF